MLFIFFNMWYYMQRTVLMNEPMIIRVCGLEYMNDDPSAVDVLYAKVSLVNDTTRWTHLVFSILSIFCSSVQITWRCAATQFRLHHCPDLPFHRFFEVEVWYYEQDQPERAFCTGHRSYALLLEDIHILTCMVETVKLQCGGSWLAHSHAEQREYCANGMTIKQHMLCSGIILVLVYKKEPVNQSALLFSNYFSVWRL